MTQVRKGISVEGKSRIAQLLRGYRRGMGLSLRKFAEKLNTSHKRLSAIEDEKSEVTREMLVGFCKASGFNLDVILACAGMIRYDYSDAVRMNPHLFVTLFHLLSPANTPSDLGDSLDQYASQLWKQNSIPAGKTDLDHETVIRFYSDLGSQFKATAIELKNQLETSS